ncbi:inosose dehydratase [Nocardioides immobilis]|uniref:Inosose dehydratase n=2 Tax=Nocardioides immobilis TaxID=2049295 RepID=A0A417Y6M7_9ACTN|nr:inosose dehydratase [Nocardioides immobilis]
MSNRLGALDGRVAAAPISWGVCEVPGWGEMLPPSRVLPEMRSLGLSATELGAPGFLPSGAGALVGELDRYGMSLVGGFVPLVLHDAGQRAETLRMARATAELFQAAGAAMFVTAVVQDYDWSRPEALDAEGMKVLAEGLAAVDDLCAEYGLTQVLHPHVDTLVETAADVELALEHTAVRWCLDTGHLRIGGVDPVQFAREHGHRVGHVHLKDVKTSLAGRVLTRELSLLGAVQHGLFQPLGSGDVAVDDVVLALEGLGYQGWYVLEQDTALTQGVPAEGSGPVQDVRACLEYLQQVTSRLPAAQVP